MQSNDTRLLLHISEQHFYLQCCTKIKIYEVTLIRSVFCRLGNLAEQTVCRHPPELAEGDRSFDSPCLGLENHQSNSIYMVESETNRGESVLDQNQSAAWFVVCVFDRRLATPWRGRFPQESKEIGRLLRYQSDPLLHLSLSVPPTSNCTCMLAQC